MDDLIGKQTWQRLGEILVLIVITALFWSVIPSLSKVGIADLLLRSIPVLGTVGLLALLRMVFAGTWANGHQIWLRPLELAVLTGLYLIFWKTWLLLVGWSVVVTVLALFPKNWKKILVVTSLVGLSIVFMFPFAWLMLTAVKPLPETMSVPIKWLPSHFMFGNFRRAAIYGYESLGYYPFLVYAVNTIVLCALIVAGTVASNSIVAYSFARLKWPGRDIAFGITLATMMVPFPILMVPTFALFRHLDWIGTYRPLWVPAWFGSAFSIFLLRQFFRTIPFELTEAAKLDGASEWRIFRTIVLPLSKASLAVVALFAFMGSWNDFLGPLIYLLDQKTFTLSLGLQAYQSQNGGTSWNLVMAASAMVIAPVIVLFFFTQRLFIQGIAITGLKG